MAKLVLTLTFAFAGCDVVGGARSKVRVAVNTSEEEHILILPRNVNKKHVAVILNPGGTVPAELYMEPMERWQVEAENKGLSMWVAVLQYWGDLPLPMALERKILYAMEKMKESGMGDIAPVFLSGHSMGGGFLSDAAAKLYGEGKVQGQILQAAYITSKFFPPMAKSFTFPVPTLTVGADLNFGSARITRMAIAAYRQRALSKDDFPVVMVKGMNHMQFASGFKKEDLKPELDEATAQLKVAQVSIDFIAKQMKIGRGSLVKSEVSKANKIFAPIWAAFELEGDAHFNVPNQMSAPNSNCIRGVCPGGSEWAKISQAHILGDEVMAKTSVLNNYADLNPFAFGEREGRKPFITEQKQVQTYVMSSNKVDDFEGDRNVPVASNELLSKYLSRQEGSLKLLGKELDATNSRDFCVELNQIAFDKAMELASPLARSRFAKDGQAMVFEPTEFKSAGPLFIFSEMKYKEKNGKMSLKSYGLFTPPGDRAIDGNLYCKQLTPARALEWIYVDGLKKKNFKIW